MTAVTALFMIPTAVVFPYLLRKANTPPSSVTLSRVRKSAHKKHGQRRHSVGDDEHGMNEHDRLVKAQDEDFDAALSAGTATRASCIFLLCYRKAPETDRFPTECSPGMHLPLDTVFIHRLHFIDTLVAPSSRKRPHRREKAFFPGFGGFDEYWSEMLADGDERVLLALRPNLLRGKVVSM